MSELEPTNPLAQVLNIAAYKFITLTNLDQWRELLRTLTAKNSLKMM